MKRRFNFEVSTEPKPTTMNPSVFIPKRVILFLIFIILVALAKAQNGTGQATKEKEVYNKLAELDSVLFSVAYTCDTAKFASLITDDIEFYHDKGGVTKSRKALVETTQKNFCEHPEVKLRRELVKGSMQVFLMDNYGAIQTGEHRFYITEKGKPEKLSGQAKFTHLWQFRDNQWRIARVLSYDHGAAQVSGNDNKPSEVSGIYSGVLKERRSYKVILPPAYEPDGQKKYDVVYVLDGDGNAELLAQMQKYELEEKFMQANIIVSVHNVDRTRDFTPTNVGGSETSGHAREFLSFLKDELIPYINKTYKSSGSNTIYGHSLGGLFAMYALIQQPSVFDAYIAVDPSFWWDDNYMTKQVAEKIASIQSPKTLLMSGRGGRETTMMGITSIDSVLKSRAPATLQWKLIEYPGETHNSIRVKTAYDGLKFIYEGINTEMTYHPMNGIVIKDKPFKVWFFGNANSVRYTSDGTTPTRESKKPEGEMILNGPSELVFKAFSNRNTSGTVLTGHFKAGEMIKGGAKPKNAKPGGMRYTYYEGEWDNVPDFKKLKSVQTGFADKDFRIGKLPKSTNFGCVFEGYFEVKEEGYYVFGMNSDDGSKLYLDNILMINNDGLHGAGDDKSFIIPLGKGFHPIRLEYFQREGGQSLQLIYLPPTAKAPSPMQIPPELLYAE